MQFRVFCLATIILSVVATLRGDDPVPSNPPLRWFKGNLHTHSLWSDGNDFPEMISEWYRVRDYNFLAMSDHNTLAEGQKWMKADAILKRGDAETVNKYQARFGGGWVEQRGEGAELEVRLKPLEEYRALVEERGKFMLFQAEEVTDNAEGKPVHLNATNLAEVIKPLGGRTVVEAAAANVRAVDEQAKKKGREMMIHLNHPNFGYAFTAEELAEIVTERFFEVYNGHPGVNHKGDKVHAGVERIWDIALTLRIGEMRAPALYGIATDDSHEYHGKGGSRPGRGWVMVESRYLSPEHIIKGIKAGRFYASSGVTLKQFAFDQETQEFTLEIDGEEGVTYETEFIGTEVAADRKAGPVVDKEGKEVRTTRVYSSEIGKTLAKATGTTAKYKLKGNELYVRATVTANKPPADPSFEGQRAQAWLQPVGWEKHVESGK